jgi:endo-1,4-beta-D-glucanase Y
MLQLGACNSVSVVTAIKQFHTDNELDLQMLKKKSLLIAAHTWPFSRSQEISSAQTSQKLEETLVTCEVLRTIIFDTTYKDYA